MTNARNAASASAPREDQAPASDRMDALRQAEESNYQVSLERLGSTVSLADDFVGAYESIAQLLRATQDPPDHLLVVSVLFLAARYELERAILDSLRGRLSGAFQSSRRAVELAAFAAKIARHPHLAEVWRKASEGGKSYDTYRKKFSKDLFPVEDELLNRLGSRFDHSSKQVHGSPMSVAARTSIELLQGGLEFTFRTFEVDNDDPGEPARTFLWVLDTHLGILRVFVRVLEDQLGDGMAAWRVREDSLDTSLGIHRERWRDRIKPRHL